MNKWAFLSLQLNIETQGGALDKSSMALYLSSFTTKDAWLHYTRCPVNLNYRGKRSPLTYV